MAVGGGAGVGVGGSNVHGGAGVVGGGGYRSLRDVVCRPDPVVLRARDECRRSPVGDVGQLEGTQAGVHRQGVAGGDAEAARAAVGGVGNAVGVGGGIGQGNGEVFHRLIVVVRGHGKGAGCGEVGGGEGRFGGDGGEVGGSRAHAGRGCCRVHGSVRGDGAEDFAGGGRRPGAGDGYGQGAGGQDVAVLVQLVVHRRGGDGVVGAGIAGNDQGIGAVSAVVGRGDDGDGVRAQGQGHLMPVGIAVGVRRGNAVGGHAARGGGRHGDLRGGVGHHNGVLHGRRSESRRQRSAADRNAGEGRVVGRRRVQSALGGRVMSGLLEHGVLGGEAEVPGVVGAGGFVNIPVPVGVDAGRIRAGQPVGRGREQGAGVLGRAAAGAGRLPGGFRIKVRRRGRGAGGFGAGHAAGVGRSRHGAQGVGGHQLALVVAHQAAHIVRPRYGGARPGGVNAGRRQGRGRGHRRQQLAGDAAHIVRPRNRAGGVGIDDAGAGRHLPGNAAHIVGARYRGRGARGRNAAAALQLPHNAADVVVVGGGAPHRGRGGHAGAADAPGGAPGNAPGVVAPGYAAGNAGAGQSSVHPAGHGAHPVAPGYAGAGEDDIGQAAGAAHRPEQAHRVAARSPAPADVQVGQRVAVALESGGIRRGGRPNGQPAFARVPVGIAGVRAAVAVGVKIECNLAVAVGAQFVAGTHRNRRRGRVVIVVGQGAAHARRRDGVGGSVGRGVGLGIHRAVAVHIVADDIQVGQVVDLNEAVVVAVVVNALGVKLFAGVVAAVVQRRVAPGPERPGVGAGRSGIQGGEQVVPVGVNARVAGGRQQLGGGLAPAIDCVGVRLGVADVLAAGVDIPVAAADQDIAKEEAVDGVDRAMAGHPADIGAGGVDRAGGVAFADDGMALPRQSAGMAAAGGHRGQGVAGADYAVVLPGDTAHPGVAGHDAGHIAADDPGVVGKGGGDGVIGEVAVDIADQPAHLVVAADIDVDQTEAFHPAVVSARTQLAEQTVAVFPAAGIDIEVGDGVAVALKDGLVRARKSDYGIGGKKHSLAERHPALARRQRAAGVVQVAGVAGGGAGGVQRVGVAVAVGVKVQVGQQFVALAARGRAAHPGHRVGEGGGVGRPAAPGPVQVVPDGVQLGQVANLNQPVAIAVVVNLDGALDGHIKAAVLQARVLAGRAKVPGVVIRVGGHAPGAVAVHIHLVPGGVDARRAVGGGGLQVAGTLARAAGAGGGLARGLRVPVAVGRRSAGPFPAHQSAGAGAADRAHGVTGRNGGVDVIPAHQPAGVVAVDS